MESIDNKIKEKLGEISGDRDQLILKHILETDKNSIVDMPMNHASAHIGGQSGKLLYHNYETPTSLKDFNEGTERIVLAILPSWGVIFPPYGLSKIAGALRKEGYACKVYDLNVQIYHNLLLTTGEDYWRSEKSFYWEDSYFFKNYLSDKIEPYITAAVDKIIEDNPTIIGFSVYLSNIHATLMMVKKLREKLTNIPIVIGGPAVATESWLLEQEFSKYVNYFFKGESEESFIDFLKTKTHLNKLPKGGVFIGNANSRINLDDTAYADFSDYDLSAYNHKDGVSIETSRGCVAQCSFCAETYFWRFRSMTPERVIAEMKHQIETYDIKRFWFVDSLVNGNLKNFEKLVDLILSNDLKIKWNSYSRCDGRMSAEFLQKVADAGCTCLSYGVESGSQKVLNDMRKKIGIWEIEQNLRDTYITNKIFTHVNWLIGFPTEEPIDCYQSNMLIYNVRKYIHQISPGMGCGPTALSDLQERYELYGIAWKEKMWDNQFLGNWYTHDYKNTYLHRFIRIKVFHIWLEILKEYADSVVGNAQDHADTKNTYTIKIANLSKSIKERVDVIDNIDFNQINENFSQSHLSNSVANEFLPLFYGLYCIFGEYEMEMIFDPSKDYLSWGNIATNYTANVFFKITEDGDYTYNISHELKHVGMTPKTEEVYKWERENTHKNMDFNNNFAKTGNVSNWLTKESMVKETIHDQYRDKSKINIFTIQPPKKLI